MNRYQEKSSYPLPNARQNLSGRTHYVDEDTLRFFKARVLSARPHCDGLIFALIESVSLDWNHTRRGFRFVVFDIFGAVIERPTMEGAFKSRAAASKAFWAWLETFDPITYTLAEIDRQERASIEEYARMRADLAAAPAKVAA